MIIAVDFDGTCVTQDFPNVGKEIGATPVLKRLTDEGHQIILWTMRSEEYQLDAVRWFKNRGIPLFGVNENPDQTWSNSHKAYAQIYIDDAALGCPLKYDPDVSKHPFVDWVKVDEMLYRIIVTGEQLLGSTALLLKKHP